MGESRASLSPGFKRLLGELATAGDHTNLTTSAHGELPQVVARSLGALRVLVNGKEVADDQWESLRAKEMFFLLLAHPDGMRKEEVFETLYPEMPASRCNSQFHSNLYRVRKALYKESVIKRDGAHMLNPKGDFTWDVQEFQDALEEASRLPQGFLHVVSTKGCTAARSPRRSIRSGQRACGERVTKSSLQALSILAGFYAGREQYDSAIQCLEKVLQADAFNDDAVFQLASYQAKGGRPTAALAFLDQYRSDLDRELGVSLPRKLVDLRQGIAAGASV